MFANSFLVWRKIYAKHLVSRHIAVEPPDFRTHFLEYPD